MDSDDEYEDYPWADFFIGSLNPFYGWVRDFEAAQAVVTEFSFATSTSYAVPRCTKKFGLFSLEEPCCDQHFVRWEDDGAVTHGSRITEQDIPFFIVGHRLMECHQGPNYRAIKGTDGNLQKDCEHSYSQENQKKRNTGSKKLGCTAAVYMREIVFFPEYKIPYDTPHYRRIKSEQLKVDLSSTVYDEIQTDIRIYIDLPRKSDHNKHIMGDAADLKAPIDQRVVDHIYSLVDDGVYNVGEIQRHVNIFVRNLFGKNSLPNQINRRFYPSRKDLRSMIDRRRRKIIQGLLDQEVLSVKVKSWRDDNPDVCIFFRQSAVVQRPTLEDEADEDLLTTAEEQPFLFVYQSSWQKHMLQRYGEEMVFLDATYRTTKYALPLFFLCVHTNSGYYVVGAFVTQREDSQSISEALSILKEQNPSWKTKSFMIDASEIEMMAINAVFPEVKVFICDFHRKQAWLRWTSAHKNAVIDHREEILSLLNGLAESLTEVDYQQNLSTLKNSRIWEVKQNLKSYIEKEWLANDKHKMWVWAYRNAMLTLIVNTNNGVESQNKVFKHDYLAPYRVKSISGLLGVLIEDYFVDARRDYLESNVTMSSGWREGGENIPKELHHRPKHLITHMRNIAAKSAEVSGNITQLDEKKFHVESARTSSKTYNVYLGDDTAMTMPSCPCVQFQRTHLPCKHFVHVSSSNEHTYRANILQLYLGNLKE